MQQFGLFPAAVVVPMCFIIGEQQHSDNATSALKAFSYLPTSLVPPIALNTTNQLMEYLRGPSTHISALPTDIVHELLRNCPSTTELFAAIRSCKHIYGIWRGHPNTILRAVVCTQLEMDEDTFPVAFGAVLHWEMARGLRIKALLKEDELLPTRLNHLRWIGLASNHGTVKRLEKEFSKRFAFQRHRLHHWTKYLPQYEK